MTDDAAFLRAICAAPDDDLPRLVYADWLDEHGEAVACGRCGGKGASPNDLSEGCQACGETGRVTDGRMERAEFIRVQCELARLEAGAEQDHRAGLGPVNVDAIGAIRRRERELYLAHARRWTARLCAAAGLAPEGEGHFPDGDGLTTGLHCGGVLLRFVWRRGFAESVTLPARTFLERCHGLRAACPLREATLTGGVDPDWFRALARPLGRECVRLCEGEAELGIVAPVYDAHRDRRSEWGRKLFLDLLHAEFRPMTFRLADALTVWDVHVRGGSVFPAREPRAFITGTP